jgi:hypothetical protein
MNGERHETDIRLVIGADDRDSDGSAVGDPVGALLGIKDGVR